MKPVALTAAAVAAFGLTVGAALAASGFVDVADNHRASAEITAAHQVGVFQGYGDGTFRPDGKLTRGQAELVIQRMLTWQGTDDDGNFEISRADAAVLAMSGLCGLDPDRIPSCAAVGAAASEAEVQAAYDRGYDEGYDQGYDEGIDDASTGSTPPPVTAPAEPPTITEPTGIPPFRAHVAVGNYIRPYGLHPYYEHSYYAYGRTETIQISFTDVRGRPSAGQTVTWWATSVHEPATITPTTIGPKTITTDSEGRASFELTQPDPDADGDNKTTLTFNIKVDDDIVLNGGGGVRRLLFTVNGDTFTGSIIFDEHSSGLNISMPRSTAVRPDAKGSDAKGSIDITMYVETREGQLLSTFADFDGDDQFGCSDLPPLKPISRSDRSYAIEMHRKYGIYVDDYRRIDGKEHRDCRGGPDTSIDYLNDYHFGEIGGAITGGGNFVVEWSGRESEEVTYRFAVDLNDDGDVADSGEIISMTHFWEVLPFEP